MVAIKSREAERFLARRPEHIFLCLLFGTDVGLVAERARQILARAVEDPKDPFQVIRLSGDALAADPLRLADEANTIPLFGGRRAIQIDALGKSFIDAIEPLFSAPPRDCTIIIAAGALKKESALRKLCEREKNAAAIECYLDAQADIGRLIEEEAAAASLSITPEAKAHLAALLGENRLVTRSEIEKLVLYARDFGTIGVDHVEAIVSEASSRTLDAALDAAFTGRISDLEVEVRKVASDRGDLRPLLSVAIGRAVELHRLRAARDLRSSAPGSPEDAAANFSPPKFGQLNPWLRERLEKQARLLSTARLETLIGVLAEAAAEARRESKLAEPLVVRALWKVASAARQGNRGHGP
jgi:DNA polymerase-3 subunit delta